MAWKSLGRPTTTAGTPQRLTAAQSDPAAAVYCHSIMVQHVKENTGYVVIGDNIAMNKATYAGCLATLAIGTANSLPAANAGFADAQNAMNAGDYYFDVTVTGEGPLVSVLIL